MRLAAIVAGLGLAVGSTALAAGPAKVSFEDTVPSGSSSSVTMVTHRPASFRVLLRVPTQGRANLFLLGRRAPQGGPLVATSPTRRTGGCGGAAGSFYCRASLEPLPRGTYTWRVTWTGVPRMPGHVELTVSW